MTLDLPDAEATARLGAAIARALQPGEAVCLYGPLGAGKSTLARGLVRLIAAHAVNLAEPLAAHKPYFRRAQIRSQTLGCTEPYTLDRPRA
jgi:ABC-type iron transport system FetAB ATPase subunit